MDFSKTLTILQNLMNIDLNESNEEELDDVITELLLAKKHINKQLKTLFEKVNYDCSTGSYDLPKENDTGSCVASDTPITNEKIEEKQNEQTKTTNPMLDNSRKFFNRSKFLSEEQQEKVLKYIHDNNITKQLAEIPSHKRIVYLQNIINKECKVSMSNYMCNKLIKTLM